MKRTPRARRRRLATSELVLGVAISYAVTDPGNGPEIAAKYGLSDADMRKIAESIGARLEAWAIRLGFENHWDEPETEADAERFRAAVAHRLRSEPDVAVRAAIVDPAEREGGAGG